MGREGFPARANRGPGVRSYAPALRFAAVCNTDSNRSLISVVELSKDAQQIATVGVHSRSLQATVWRGNNKSVGAASAANKTS